MHDNHFMHRYRLLLSSDLKPENILFDKENASLKVVDLGSAVEF